jgi:hypothetical protein
MQANDPASLCRTMPDRQVMLKRSGIRQDFLLSPQHSLLILAEPLNPEPLNLSSRCNKIGDEIVVDGPPGFERLAKIPG